jgi:hypothetical protein
MAWKKQSSRYDKQGGKWDNYKDTETGEKIF